MDKNPAHKAATWRYLKNTLRPTVALIQEADGVPETAGGRIVERADAVRYETAVVAYQGQVAALPPVRSRYSPDEFDISPTVPGAFAAGQLSGLPGVEPIVAVSMYGRIIKRYAQTTILRSLADLIPLMDAPAYKDRVILGGDLNAFDQPPADRVSRERWAVLFDLFSSMRLVNLLELTQAERGPLAGCRCDKAACYHVETWRYLSKKPGVWCTDYLFASKDLANRLTSFEVWNDRGEVWELSDHAPLVARFDL